MLMSATRGVAGGRRIPLNERSGKEGADQQADLFMPGCIPPFPMRHVHRTHTYAIVCDRDVQYRSQAHAGHHFVIVKCILDALRRFCAKRLELQQDLARPRGTLFSLTPSSWIDVRHVRINSLDLETLRIVGHDREEAKAYCAFRHRMNGTKNRHGLILESQGICQALKVRNIKRSRG